VADQVLLCAKQHNFQDVVALAHRYKLGVEVQTFAYPQALEGDWKSLLDEYRIALRPLSGEIAMHGPFLDMASGSPDPLINQVVRHRVQQALLIAAELGAHKVVFHANFIASIHNPEYRIDWTQRQIEFWSSLAEEAWDKGLMIALENMWEFTPDIIGDVLRKLNLPGLRACVDVGHAHLFSDVPFTCWLQSLNSYVVHVHINNNSGAVDEHHALSDGVLNYPEILAQIRRLPHSPTLALEVDRVSDMEQSFALLDLPE